MGSAENSTSRYKMSDSTNRQIQILLSLSGHSDTIKPNPVSKREASRGEGRGEGTRDSGQFHINDIAAMSGLRDEKEVQRYLYILEGQKLVSPFPEGDFTSKTWFITKHGLEALKTIRG